jgi:hypothetical protein
MRTKIEWAELRAPLFLAGTNLSTKLDHKIKGGVLMEYDEDKRNLFVTFNGHVARIPEASILVMVEKATWTEEAKATKAAEVATGKPLEAQASTPTSHVHAGLGGGDTGQTKPKPLAK